MLDLEEKITRIFLLRSSNLTAIMVISLEWNTPPIKRIEMLPTLGIHGYSQESVWIEGELKLVVNDFLERVNLKVEELIDTLNKVDVPVIGYPNDLLQIKLKNGYDAITLNHDIPDEYKENERLEIIDVVNNLHRTKRIINKSGSRIDTVLGKDILAMVVKVFKLALIKDMHHLYTMPYSMPDYTRRYTNRVAYLHQQQIDRIKQERSQYNP